MNNDYNSLMAGFDTSPLTLDQGTLSGGFDFMNVSQPSSPTTSAGTQSSASQANSTSQVSGFQSVLNTLTGLFNGGIAAYNDVAQKTGLPTAAGQPTVPAPTAPVVYGGFNQTQLITIGVGAVLVVALLFLARR